MAESPGKMLPFGRWPLQPLAGVRNHLASPSPAAHHGPPGKTSRGRCSHTHYLPPRHSSDSLKLLLLVSRDEEHLIPREITPIFPGPSFDSKLITWPCKETSTLTHCWKECERVLFWRRIWRRLYGKALKTSLLFDLAILLRNLTRENNSGQEQIPAYEDSHRNVDDNKNWKQKSHCGEQDKESVEYRRACYSL